MATTSPLARIPLPQSSDTDAVPADLLTEAAFLESMLVVRFASAAERTTHLTAAGLGSGVRGMLSFNSATGNVEQFDGTTWLPLVPMKLIPTSGTPPKGAAWDGVTQLIKREFSVVTTTNGAGGFSVNFPAAFPNGVLKCNLTPGDNAGNLGIITPTVGSSTLAYWQGIAYSPTGAALVTAGIRIDVDVIGW